MGILRASDRRKLKLHSRQISVILGKAHPLPKSTEFSETLLRAVDEGLLVPGEIVRAAIYERIEKSYQIKREEIPEKLSTFDEALRELLGAAAKVLEKVIARNLYRALGLNFTAHDAWTSS
jgi:adenylate kinase family enzyme